MTSKEILDLQKDIEAKRLQIVKLQHEVEQRDQRIIGLEHVARRGAEKERKADAAILDFEHVLGQSSQKAADQEREKFIRSNRELAAQNKELQIEVNRLQTHCAHMDEKDAEIAFLRGKLGEDESLSKEISDNAKLRRDLQDKANHVSVLAKNIEELKAENRVLREMANVPANFGIDFSKIQETETVKITEYQSRIKRLETELEENEEERAQLIYKLRKQSTLYGEKGVRFHNLSADQMLMVDEFAQNLREGKVELPINDLSRELMRENEQLKAQIHVLQTSVFGGGVEISDKLLDLIHQENIEVKELLMKLHVGGATQPTPQETETVSRHVLQLPPFPFPEDFKDGYSFRFSSQIPVAEIWTGNKDRDLSALQLQVVELVELLDRRDEDDKITALELEEIRNKLREILLVQEELFKQYARNRDSSAEENKNLQNLYEKTLFELREARAQLGVYEDTYKAISVEDPRSLKAKISEMTSKIALLELNALRMSRKYDLLSSQENDLRQAYHTIESENAEKDVLVVKRIGRLKEWRVSATHQLQFLFRQLRQSIPLEQYEYANREMGRLQEEKAEWLLREADLLNKIVDLEGKSRENKALIDKLRDLQEMQLEFKSELAITSKMLEVRDPLFKQQQKVIRKLVEYLKANYISPQQAFAAFDKNKDGKISPNEFHVALRNLGIQVSSEELDGILERYEGNIPYRDFICKLRMYGLEAYTEQQQILQVIYDGITRVNYSLYDAFKVFDQDSDDFISRQDLYESLAKFGIGLSPKQMEDFLNLIDSNRDGKIDFSEFSGVFERELNLVHKEANWKDELFLALAETSNISLLEETLIQFDANEDGRVNKQEFLTALKQIRVKLTKNQMDELWNTMSLDGYLSYPEFLGKFKRAVRIHETSKIVDQAKSYSKSHELYERRIYHLESELSQKEHKLAELEQKYIEMRGTIRVLKEDDVTLRARLISSVSKSEAERLRQSNENLQKELAESRSAILTYKALVGVTADQAKAFKLALERRKDEIQGFQLAIRELSSESQEALAVGKLFHQTLVSRWAEASANRKYDSLIEETRTLRGEVFRFEGELMEREQALYDVQQVLTEKINFYENRLRIPPGVSLEKLSEIVASLRVIASKKSEVEELNKYLTTQILELGAKVDEAKLMKQTADDIFAIIQRANPDEVSYKLVELAERYSSLKLSELKARRENALSKEREEYLGKLHAQDQETIKRLEEEVASWEKVLIQKEQVWRQKEEERQKMLLNPKFQFVLPPKEPTKNKPEIEVRRKDHEIAQLREQLRVTENNVRLKQEQVEYLSKLRQENKADSIQPQSAFTADELLKIQSEAEADALASAANSTLTTMQEMLDSKSAQLSRAEESIRKLKQELVKTQHEASKEIQRLAHELREANDSSHSQVLNALETATHRPRTSAYKPEIDKLIATKDKKLEEISYKLNAALNAKDKIEEVARDLQRELEHTKYELSMERSKNIGAAHSAELEAARLQIQAKEQELDVLKKSLAQLKEDLIKAAENNAQQPAAPQQILLDTGDNTFMTQRINKCEQRIASLTKQLKEAKAENERVKRMLENARENETKARAEIERIININVKRVDSLTKENEALKRKLEGAKKESPKKPPEIPQRDQSAEVRALRERIGRLEGENKKLADMLNKSKPPPVTIQDETVLKKLSSVLNSKRISIPNLVDNAPSLFPHELRRFLESRGNGLSEEEIQAIIDLATTQASATNKQGQVKISMKKLDSLLKHEPEKDRKSEILMNQLNEMKRELEYKDKQIHHLEAQAKQASQQVEIVVPPPQAVKDLSEELKKAQAAIFELEELNENLQQKIQVILKTDIKQLKTENKDLNKEYEKVFLENMRLKGQIKELRHNRIKDAEGIIEDELYTKDLKIQQLEEDIEDNIKMFKNLREKSKRQDEELIQLRFDKAQFDLRIDRLQKRLRDCEIPTKKHETVVETHEEEEKEISSIKIVEKIKTEAVLKDRIESLEEELAEFRTAAKKHKKLEERTEKINEDNLILRRELERELKKNEQALHLQRKLAMEKENLEIENERLMRALDELTL